MKTLNINVFEFGDKVTYKYSDTLALPGIIICPHELGSCGKVSYDILVKWDRRCGTDFENFDDVKEERLTLGWEDEVDPMDELVEKIEEIYQLYDNSAGELFDTGALDALGAVMKAIYQITGKPDPEEPDAASADVLRILSEVAASNAEKAEEEPEEGAYSRDCFKGRYA